MIDSIKKKTNAQTLITCGSSKGGTAALYFGLRCHANHIICGGPQYYIGNYLLGLNKPGTISDTEFELVLQGINDVRHGRFIGVLQSGSYESYVRLNSLLKMQISKSSSWAKSYKIHIHYSINDYTYNAHIDDLINVLKLHGYYVEDIDHYTSHDDLGIYFSAYLQKTLDNIIHSYL
ncbi:MAG: hypothetical protein PHV32_05670 [Eubacteriales bacterium]|nr:hypothetical protein [Eubacteriales bacterium]